MSTRPRNGRPYVRSDRRQGDLRIAAKQAVPIAIAAAEMTAAEREFGAIVKLIIAAAMIGTIRPRGEIFVSAVIAKAQRQLPRILPIGDRRGVRRFVRSRAN